MSIFKKDCPECAAPNPVDAVRCNCGYSFDTDALGSDAEEQDRLYLDYLEARIAQAEAEAIVARQQANAERGNTLKAATALQAEQALNALQAELKQLASRVPPRPKRANPPPVAKPIAKPIALPASTPLKSSPPQSEGARFSASKTKAAGKRSRTHELAPPVRVVATQPAKAAKTSAVASAKPMSPMPSASMPATSPAKPATPHVAAKPKVVAHRFAKSAAPATPAREPVAAAKSAPKPVVQPSAQFRVLQARKAEAIARTLPRTENAAGARNDAQPRREPSILHAARDASTKTCPSCSALVAIDLEACRCGYAFSSVTDVPALTPEAPIALAPVSTKPTQECPNCTAVLPLDRNTCNCGYEFSHADQVPGISLDAGALSILTEGIGRRR